MRLTEACIEIGGGSGAFKALLAYHLKTTIPFRNKILLCHGCNNSKCSNVNHLYWGSYRDNSIDAFEAGVAFGGESKKISKKQRIEIGKNMGTKYGGKNKLSEERKNEIRNIIALIERKRGWKTKAAITLGVSHSQIIRYERIGLLELPIRIELILRLLTMQLPRHRASAAKFTWTHDDNLFSKNTFRIRH